MLLHREARIPTAELERRCELFRRGEWSPPHTEVEARAARATALVHPGELSAAARALVSQPLAPGSSDTLQRRTDPKLLTPLPTLSFSCSGRGEQCALPLHPFFATLRTASRGSALDPEASLANTCAYCSATKPTAHSCTALPSGLRVLMCQYPSLRSSEPAASLPDACPTVACMPWSSATCCGG